MENYEAHELEIILFSQFDSYVTAWASDGEEGEDQYRINPEVSDI